MANLNRVLLIGNLTRDPELRASQGGTQIAKFGMAINRHYTVNGQKKEETCFVDMTAFGRQAETIGKYMKKGRQLFVEGRLEFQQWETKEGQKRSKLAVVVENFQFLSDGQKSGGGSKSGGAREGSAEGSGGGSGDDDWGSSNGGYGAEGASDIPF